MVLAIIAVINPPLTQMAADQGAQTERDGRGGGPEAELAEAREPPAASGDAGDQDAAQEQAAERQDQRRPQYMCSEQVRQERQQRPPGEPTQPPGPPHN